MPPQRSRVLTEITLDKIAAVDMPCQEPAIATIMKRSYTEDERTAMADKGEALPDGSFPIKDKADLGNAIQLHGHASDKAKAKAHIITRAKALDATDALPEEWGIGKSVAASVELAKIDMPAARGFAEILAENEACEARWEAESEMWPLFDALRTSLASIATDPAVGDGDKIGRVTESVNEFISALKAEWPDVADAVDKIAKASPNADRMAPFINAGLSGAKEAQMSKMTQAEITKASGAIESDPILKAHVQALCDLSFDKGKVEGEAGTAEAVEKAKADCMAENAMEDENGKPTAKGAVFIAKHSAGDETITVGGEVISKAAVGESTFKAMKAQQTQINDEIEKRVFAEMEKKVETDYPSLVGTTAEKALILKHIAGAPDAVRKSADAILAAAEKAIKGAFSTVGHKGGELPATANIAKAKQDFGTKVAEIQKRDSCTRTEAMEKAEREAPELFKAMQDGDAEQAIAA